MRLNPFASSSQAERADDYGFGEKLSSKGVRLLDKNGRFNVLRRGGRAWFAYQWLIEMSWWKFFASVLAYYVAINLLLGIGFFLLGADGISGIAQGPWYQRLAGCFFFSVQTFTTVGYGSMAPVTIAQQVLAGFGALVGLMSLALATGLFFARFSRPRQMVLFSERALISPYDSATGFMFRLASRSSSKLINVKAQVVYSWIETVEGNQRLRRFMNLPLERDQIAMLPLNWTIVHPIDGDSPLVNCSTEDLTVADGEFIVQVSGYDQTFAREVYAHTSYRATCIDFGRQFAPMYHPGPEGKMVLHLDRIDQTEDASIDPQSLPDELLSMKSNPAAST